MDGSVKTRVMPPRNLRVTLNCTVAMLNLEPSQGEPRRGGLASKEASRYGRKRDAQLMVILQSRAEHRSDYWDVESVQRRATSNEVVSQAATSITNTLTTIDTAGCLSSDMTDHDRKYESECAIYRSKEVVFATSFNRIRPAWRAKKNEWTYVEAIQISCRRRTSWLEISVLECSYRLTVAHRCHDTIVGGCNCVCRSCLRDVLCCVYALC